MANNDKAQIAALSERIAALEAALRRIEAKLAPTEAPKPRPDKTAALPKWATPAGNFGMLYGGPPSVPQTGAVGTVGVKRDSAGNWRDPSGHLRDGSGAYVSSRPTEPVVGMPRSEAHQAAVDMADQLFSDRKDNQ
jgi:hypothetical protein